MTLLCERCFCPIDPDSERYYQLAHIARAYRTGEITWNHSTVHTDPCPSPVGLADAGEQRWAA